MCRRPARREGIEIEGKPVITKTLQLWLALAEGRITEEEFREMLIERTREYMAEIGNDGRHAPKRRSRKGKSNGTQKTAQTTHSTS